MYRLEQTIELLRMLTDVDQCIPLSRNKQTEPELIERIIIHTWISKSISFFWDLINHNIADQIAQDIFTSNVYYKFLNKS
jgi:hypothetical protein